MPPASAPSAIATTTLPAAASSTSVAAAPSSAFLLRPSFVYNQRAPQKIFSVQRLDGLHRFSIVANFSETESARLIRKTIPQQRE
jgi:hypothetical protein